MAILTNPLAEPQGLTSGYGRITTDTESGTMYMWASTNATESANDIRANGISQAADEANISFNARDFNGLQSLTTGATYFNHFVQDSDGDGLVVTSATYTLVNDRPDPSGPQLTRLATVPLTLNASPASAITNYFKHPSADVIYSAGQKEGNYVLGISTPSLPVQQDSARFYEPNGDISIKAVRDVKVYDNRMYSVGRSINFNDDNEAGLMNVYGLGDPLAPDILGVFRPLDARIGVVNGNPVPYDQVGVTRWANNWYQNMTTDGDFIYVASQRFGLTVIDYGSAGTVYTISNVTTDAQAVITIPAGHPYADGGTSPSGLSGSGDLIFITGTGIAGIDDLHHNVISVSGNDLTIDVSGGAGSSGGSITTTLRIESTFTEQDLFDAGFTDASFHWETSSIAYGDGWVSCGNHPTGVIALDVSTPSAPTNPQDYSSTPENGPVNGGNTSVELRPRGTIRVKDHIITCENVNFNVDRAERGAKSIDVSDPEVVGGWNWEPIGIADNDLWIDFGDQPNQGLSEYRDYTIIANGNKLAMFDIIDPDNMVYLGAQGLVNDDTVNIYQSFFFLGNDGKTYAYTADGYSENTTNQIWVYQVSGGRVADLYLGVLVGGVTVDGSQSLSGAVARGAATTIGNYELPDPPEGLEWRQVDYLINGALTNTRTVELGLYPAASATDGTVADEAVLIEDTVHTEEKGVQSGDITYTLATPVQRDPGFYSPHAVRVTGPGGVSINSDATYSHPKTASLSTEDELPAEYPASAAGPDGLIIAAGFDLFAIAKPVLVTPYPSQTISLQDILSFDVTTAWSGADSYTINGLTYALQDVSDVISGMVIDSGTRNFNIEAHNEFGTSTDSFYLQVLSTIPTKIRG